MGRHSKIKASKQTEDPNRIVSATADPIDETLVTEIEKLGALRDALDETIASGMATPATARERASVARAIVSVSSESRARDAHVRRWGAKLNEEQRDQVVIEYLRAMTPERLAVVREAIEAIEHDDGPPLLG